MPAGSGECVSRSHDRATTSVCCLSCRSEGGMFKAKLKFPKDYPSMPPAMTITSQFYHPNVYEDGRVCIS